jgi:hypothetical protein
MLGLVIRLQHGFDSIRGRSVPHTHCGSFILHSQRTTGGIAGNHLQNRLAMQCMASAVGLHAQHILTLWVDRFGGCLRHGGHA